jgi:hypothetical protein
MASGFGGRSCQRLSTPTCRGRRSDAAATVGAMTSQRDTSLQLAAYGPAVRRCVDAAARSSSWAEVPYSLRRPLPQKRAGRAGWQHRRRSHIVTPTPASDDLKRCTCREEKPQAEFSRDRSRKDGRAPWCKACVRRWQEKNAEHLADYHRRWQQANRDKQRAQNRRYRERKRDDPGYRERRRANARRRDQERRAQDLDYVERRRANNRRYRQRQRARVPDAPRGANDGSWTPLAGWHHAGQVLEAVGVRAAPRATLGAGGRSYRRLADRRRPS